jgi:hypothetical protein
MTTPKEVFLYLSKKYAKCKTFKDCYEEKIDEFICQSLQELHAYMLISEELLLQCKEILHDNKPDGDHWLTSTTYWRGELSWWSIYTSNYDGRVHEVFQDKSKFLLELSNSL